MSKVIFSDFDGTLTDNGHMSAVFFELISHLQKHDYELIIVSGRSVSWGHFLLTHLPLKTCIMEGGGTISSVVNNNIIDHPQVDDITIKHLETVSNAVSKMDGVVMSTDSFGRLTDRAVEFKLMEEATIKHVEKFLTSHQIKFSYSNVHLNFWAGEISKFKAVQTYAKDNNIDLSQCYYFGDALNDQSMFKHFKNSVGVSNIKPFLDKMDCKPSIILEGDENREIHGVLNFVTKKLQ